MALLVIIIIGVAVFCFFQGYWISGIICLLGFSKQIGFIALVITSIVLFTNGHWIVGIIPLLLVGINLFFMSKTRKENIINR